MQSEVCILLTIIANHNVKTYINKEELTVATTKPTTHASKPPRSLNYPYHICGIVSHKLTNCLRFDEMQNILKDKGDKSIESKPTCNIKTIVTLVDMVDVNVTTCSKTNEKKKSLKTESQGKINLH